MERRAPCPIYRFQTRALFDEIADGRNIAIMGSSMEGAIALDIAS